MFCNKCGSELNDNDEYCSKCGTKVNKDKKTITIKLNQFIIGIVLVVLIVAGMGFLIINKSKREDINNSSIGNNIEEIDYSIETSEVLLDRIKKEYPDISGYIFSDDDNCWLLTENGRKIYFSDEESFEKALKEFNELLNEDKVYAGIGMVLAPYEDKNRIGIYGVFQDCPAQKAGIVPGDLIISIDDIEYFANEYEKASKALKGEIGTSVNIKIMRNNDIYEFNIKREQIDLSKYDLTPPNSDSLAEDGTEEETTTTQQNSNNSTSSNSNNNNTKKEKYYIHTAISGCVITSSDSKTGAITYKEKCEKCGTVSSKEHSTYLTMGTMKTYFNCYKCNSTQKLEIETTSERK